MTSDFIRPAWFGLYYVLCADTYTAKSVTATASVVCKIKITYLLYNGLVTAVSGATLSDRVRTCATSSTIQSETRR